MMNRKNILFPKMAFVIGKPIKPVFADVITACSTPPSSAGLYFRALTRKYETAIAAMKNMTDPITTSAASRTIDPDRSWDAMEESARQGTVT